MRVISPSPAPAAPAAPSQEPSLLRALRERFVVSVEIDPTRADTSAQFLSARPNVRVVHGDWTELRDDGPFDLLVLDAGGKGKEPDDPPLDPTDGWLAVGGTIVLDDFTPCDAAHDEARRYWLEHPALQATELLLTPTLSTIVGRRVR